MNYCPLDLGGCTTLLQSKVLNRKDEKSETFGKIFKISPSGSNFLVADENCTVSIYDLQNSIVQNNLYYRLEHDGGNHHYIPDHASDLKEYNDSSQYKSDIGGQDKRGTISPRISQNLGDVIYDVAWMPDNETNMFAASSRDHPIHIWDMKGKIWCSFVGRNDKDELSSAFSIAFNNSGTKIYAGGCRSIRSWDVSQPQRVVQELNVGKGQLGQKGILSTISFNPDRSGLFAAGSLNKSIGIYADTSTDAILQLRGLDMGVTHLKWSPCGNMLWSCGQTHSDIVCHDIRRTGKELGRVSRATRFVDHNSRSNFDLDPWGKNLVTVDQAGEIMFFDAVSFKQVEPSTSYTISPNLRGMQQVEKESNVREDVFYNVQFHPYSSLLLLGCSEMDSTSDASQNSLGSCEMRILSLPCDRSKLAHRQPSAQEPTNPSEHEIQSVVVASPSPATPAASAEPAAPMPPAPPVYKRPPAPPVYKRPKADFVHLDNTHVNLSFTVDIAHGSTSQVYQLPRDLFM
jgi:hypothetical protein